VCASLVLWCDLAASQLPRAHKVVTRALLNVTKVGTSRLHGRVGCDLRCVFVLHVKYVDDISAQRQQQDEREEPRNRAGA
jgi:hypothetical protein